MRAGCVMAVVKGSPVKASKRMENSTIFALRGVCGGGSTSEDSFSATDSSLISLFKDGNLAGFFFSRRIFIMKN